MRRMALRTMDKATDYIKFLQQNAAEIQALYQDILINVTGFFRDPDAFEALKEHVFPVILSGKTPSSSIRIWVPGCSTGQEAFSLAMVVLEYLDGRHLRVPIQIFATDLSDTASL